MTRTNYNSEDLSKIEKVESQSFVALNVWERKHIEEWVRSHPEILGEDLLIVSMEFDRFEGSKDRLDLLAVDREGNLVVVELKRDSWRNKDRDCEDTFRRNLFP